jgi:hypothetical protein
MKRPILTFLAAFAIVLGITPMAQANADPNLGCETIHWGFLGSQLRSICDGPRQHDGSWMRYRVVWRPAHYVSASSYCGTYSCSYSGGYYVDDTVFAKANYVVFDANVLPDEPGWLPAGRDVLR